MARIAPPALGLCLLLTGAGAARAQAPPASTGPGGPPKALDVPAPILVPEPVVEPPPRRVEALPLPQRTRRMRLELVVGGAGLLTSVWAAERLLAQDLTSHWTHWLPIVGPWSLLVQERQKTTPSDAITAFLVIDGVAQAAGATMAVLGLVLRKERLVIRLPPAPPVSLRLGGQGLAFAF